MDYLIYLFKYLYICILIEFIQLFRILFISKILLTKSLTMKKKSKKFQPKIPTRQAFGLLK